MAIPTPGLLSKLAPWRSQMADALLQKAQRLHFAHSDWAGYSVFEEAFALGHAAGSHGP
jgi:hypothetical protein